MVLQDLIPGPYYFTHAICVVYIDALTLAGLKVSAAYVGKHKFVIIVFFHIDVVILMYLRVYVCVYVYTILNLHV